MPQYKSDEAGSRGLETEIQAENGRELLDKLPEKFTENSTIEVTGKVYPYKLEGPEHRWVKDAANGREETTILTVRTDVADIQREENDSFWALLAVWSDGSDSLLLNGNYYDQGDDAMRSGDTTRDSWNWREEGMGLVGKLTPWDVYNIGRYDEISRAVVRATPTSVES